jgi:hypothetical protein
MISYEAIALIILGFLFCFTLIKAVWYDQKYHDNDRIHCVPTKILDFICLGLMVGLSSSLGQIEGVQRWGLLICMTMCYVITYLFTLAELRSLPIKSMTFKCYNITVIFACLLFLVLLPTGFDIKHKDPVENNTSTKIVTQQEAP